MRSPETPDATYCYVWFHEGNPEAVSCVSCDMVLTAPLDYHLFLLLHISTNLISILASFLFLGLAKLLSRNDKSHIVLSTDASPAT